MFKDSYNYVKVKKWPSKSIYNQTIKRRRY